MLGVAVVGAGGAYPSRLSQGVLGSAVSCSATLLYY